MTVDVDPPFSQSQSPFLKEGLNYLLSIFDKHSIKATFFVPAKVAINFPRILNKIVDRKHEIGCHGLEHDPLETTLDVNKQIRIIKTATEIIESVTGLRPVGYRAPLFKHNTSCWVALQRNGYIYDSSYACSPFYGSGKLFINGRPFYIRFPQIGGNNLLEIPVSINPFLPFPLGGGWLRIFGLKWAKVGIKMNLVFRIPVVFYTHPKDVSFNLNGFKWSWYYYLNTASCGRMIEDIIKYAKKNCVEFLKAGELAKLFNES